MPFRYVIVSSLMLNGGQLLARRLVSLPWPGKLNWGAGLPCVRRFLEVFDRQKHPFRPCDFGSIMLDSIEIGSFRGRLGQVPKQKTHKGTKKRFRLSATGKAKHRQSGTSHLAARMSQKRKRNLRGTAVVDKTVQQSIHKALAGNSY